ncbi:MAG TPA: C25 family cysteine peptidase [Saprospiraceae bacterium]|nr:C25 family cysteine peptidase [Saprospiraceae bacterium]
MQKTTAIALALLCSLCSLSLRAQMWNGADTLYGHEWIRYDRPYFKILLADDGMYRIPAATLTAQGVPLETLTGAQFQMFYMGQEEPLFVSTDGTFGANDFIEFYGRRNRGELDRHLYRNPDAEMLNPLYSISTDTSAYFLTWVNPGTPTLRYPTLNNDLSNAPPKEEWFWDELRQVFGNAVVQKADSESVSESRFDEGEGYSRDFLTTLNINFAPKFIHPAPVNSIFRMRMFSNNRPHDLRISVNGTTLYNETFNGYRLRDYTVEKPTANLSANEQLRFNGIASGNDRHAVAWASLRYPRAFNFDNQNSFAFQLPAAAQDRYLEISNFNAGAAPVLYDLTRRTRTVATVNAGLTRLIVPASNADVNLLLVNASAGVRTVSNIRPVTFVNYQNADAEYLIISHPRLMDDGNGGNPVQAYADYRASQAGGGFRTVILDVTQLYDQFAYGVHRHPLAVRNAVQYLARRWPEAKYAFIIGKGRQYNAGRTAAAVAGDYYVPTFGVPGSDNLLFAGNWTNVPVLPIGRIAASTPIEVRWYLDKVISHEAGRNSTAEADREWKKEVIHLGGGGSTGEQQFIKNALGQMENIVRNGDMGANVQSFFKTNFDPIQQAVSDVLLRRINDGASIITFFGHSGPVGFDFAIDDPATYQNAGRFPAMISLGCHAGQIHQLEVGARSVGEDFVFQNNKGAIAFISTTGYGYISALSTYAQSYLNLLNGSHYGRGLGDVQRKVTEQYDAVTGLPLLALVHQFTLHGDPAVVISPPDKPDLVLRASDASVAPRSISVQNDSLEFSFSVRNIGRAVGDSCALEIIREFPGGVQVTALRQRIPVPKLADNYVFRLPVWGERSVGFNRFFVKIDADNEIEEGPGTVAEQNNQLVDTQGREGIDFVVFANGAIPLYPPDLGIAGGSDITLHASSADAFAPELLYLVEIDTTLHFDSPGKRSFTTTQTGGLISIRPNIAWRDSTVYYWRISPDSLPGIGYAWRSSSFLYLAGSTGGWNQSHFFQWAGNRYINTQLPENNRRLSFLEDAKFIRIKNGVYPGFDNMGININSEPYNFIPYDSPVTQGVYIFSLDSITLDPWLNPKPGLYGSSQGTGWGSHAHFPYRTTTPEWRQKAINFLRDTIPSGNYVILYTLQTNTQSYMPEAWAADSVAFGTNLFQVLEQQGAQLIRSSAETGSRPYIIMYKKDDPSFPVVERISPDNQPIFENVIVNGRWNRGEVRTERIGPARNWRSLHWKITENTAEDEWSLNVYGVRRDSTEALLISNLQALDAQLESVNAAEFPYLKLQFKAADTTFRTAPQIPYWRVLFDELPEAVLNPALAFSFHKDSLQQGEPLSMQVAVNNITAIGMDSLLLRFTVTDQAGNRQVILRKTAPLPANDTIMAALQLDTRPMTGPQQLRMEVNPDRAQPEQHLFNNNGLKDFFVGKDLRNPLLDVTFDGQRIMDGDIVSAKPLIVIALRDENRWLRLDDTSLFKVLLRAPDAPDVRSVAIGSDEMRFLPAAGNGDNRATLEWSPQFSESGLYTLIVQGRDATGNASGQVDFRVNFEVITEARISNVLNYPNPFTTATRFVYTLTGEEAPATFVIRIMTVSGRIVHELTQDDLGPLRIGTHTTEQAWDGTDMYGDRLANGVYLYQVFAKDREGKDLIRHDTGTDAFFKGGIGKLVILR